MCQGRIVAELAVFIARNAVDLANRREQFRLLDGVDSEVGLEIEVQVQHVLRITGLFDYQSQEAFLHIIDSCAVG